MSPDSDMQRNVLNLVRKGTVAEVDHQKALCRVATGDLVTGFLPWLATAAGHTTNWRAPSVNEQVLLLSPGGDLAEAVVLPGIYSDDMPPSITDKNIHVTRYPDGGILSYDHQQHQAIAMLPHGASIIVIAPESVTIQTANATIRAETITLDCATANITGGLNVGKDIRANGDVKAGPISLGLHNHMEMGDGKLVGAPQ